VRRNVGQIGVNLSVVWCWIVCVMIGCGSRSTGIMRLLPSQSVLNGWRASGSPEVYGAQSLYERIDGGAEIFLEYGFDRALYQDYDRNDDSLQVEIYDMVDDTAAFGMFSINRSPRAKNVPVGGAGQQYGDTVTFWQRDYYVVVRFFGNADTQGDVTLDVARDIERKIGGDGGTLPAAVSLLPTRGKVEGSETVVRGAIALSQICYLGQDEPFGLARGKEAAVATYRIGNDSFSLLVMKYGSRGELDEAFERAATVFSNQFELAERSDTRVTAKDRRGEYILADKNGTVLAIVCGARSADVAGSVLSQTG